jgi:hypothetical protein
VLDGANYGAPLTTAPYSFSWNSTTVPNGTHTWAAVARDAAGNTATSAAVSFTVSNAAAQGLVAAYAFDENGGTTAGDSSGNGNTGTLSNATWVAGKFGTPALQFTGATTSWVTMNDATSLHLTTGLTLEAWVDPSSLNSPDAGWCAAVAKDNRASSANDVSYALYAAAGTGTGPALHLNLSGKGDTGVQGASVLPLNTWTFLAATYDGTTMKLYVNGTLVASKTVSGSIASSTNPLHVGGDWSGEMFTGVIDQVRVYNRALSAAEISTDMNLPVGAQPLQVAPHSARTAARGGTSSAPLSAALIDPIIQEAITLWADAGIDPARLQILSHVTVQVTALPPAYLGLAFDDTIWLSADAAGYGWFTDPSLTASPPAGEVDLLTVVLHEMGHLLGYGDDAANDLMGEVLLPGERLLP